MLTIRTDDTGPTPCPPRPRVRRSPTGPHAIVKAGGGDRQPGLALSSRRVAVTEKPPRRYRQGGFSPNSIGTTGLRMRVGGQESLGPGANYLLFAPLGGLVGTEVAPMPHSRRCRGVCRAIGEETVR